MQWLYRTGILVILLLISGLLVACEDESQSATELERVPPVVDPSDANLLPEDIQKLEVSIDDGRFESEVYEVQQGAIQMIVHASGGPYELAIERLAQPQDVAADGETTIGFTASEPGEYTIRLTEGGEGTAILNVRPVGGE